MRIRSRAGALVWGLLIAEISAAGIAVAQTVPPTVSDKSGQLEVTRKDAAFRAELQAAIDKSDVGNWTNALKEFDRLVPAYPNEAQARFERAMVLLNLNRDAAAIADLEQVLKLAPEYPGARHGYAIALAGQGRYMLAAEVRLRELQAL